MNSILKKGMLLFSLILCFAFSGCSKITDILDTEGNIPDPKDLYLSNTEENMIKDTPIYVEYKEGGEVFAVDYYCIREEQSIYYLNSGYMDLVEQDPELAMISYDKYQGCYSESELYIYYPFMESDTMILFYYSPEIALSDLNSGDYNIKVQASKDNYVAEWNNGTCDNIAVFDLDMKLLRLQQDYEDKVVDITVSYGSKVVFPEFLSNTSWSDTITLSFQPVDNDANQEADLSIAPIEVPVNMNVSLYFGVDYSFFTDKDALTPLNSSTSFGVGPQTGPLLKDTVIYYSSYSPN